MIHYNTIRDPYLIVLIRGLAEFPHAQSGSKRGSRELHLRFRSFQSAIVAILSHQYGQFITNFQEIMIRCEFPNGKTKWAAPFQPISRFP